MNRSIFTKYNIFLEWWWFFCSLILIFFVLGTINLYEIVWNADQTKISYGILALFGAVSVFCGREAWKLSKLKRDNLDAEPSLKTKYETGWFASEGNHDPWLQVDFGETYEIRGVVTQGGYGEQTGEVEC